MAAELSAVAHQCTRKRTYADRAEAKQAQRAMHTKTGKLYKRYSCPFCGRYHLATRGTKGG